MGRVALAAALVAVVLSGCGERPEPVEQAEMVYPVTVGGKTFAERPSAVVTPERSSMPVLLEALGYESEGEIDVLLAWAGERGAAAAQEAERGYVGADTTVDGVVRSIAEIGLILGVPEAARALVDRIGEQREQVREMVAGREPVRVFVDLGFFATAGERTLIGDLVREAGGENVAGPTPEPGPFPLRQLEELDPDVYILASDARATPADLRANPRTRRLTAVRENRVVVIDVETLKPGPRIGEGLVALAAAFHPATP